MHDGQNVFAHVESARWDTWCANSALEAVVAQGRIEPWVIVAIDHGQNRFEEYSPWPEPRLGIEGHGDAYVRFIADTLRPQIEQDYRVRTGSQWTAVMGSSLGGLVSLYAGLTRPDVFGRVGGVSPTVMWCLGRIFDEWREHTHRWSRIYLDVGSNERIMQAHVPLDYAEGVVAFAHQLEHAGYGPHELRLVVEPEAGHHEIDWQRRLPETFAWLLG
jgi:predicted alpha/beta superfamily hydrolase